MSAPLSDSAAARPTTIEVAVKILPHGEGLALPEYKTAFSAGADLLAAVTADTVIPAGGRALVPTGLSIALPMGYEAQVRPRSGLALKNGITCLNTPGTIDADYRGEVGVILANLGQEDFTVERGMRIAQIVIAPVTQLQWQIVDDLEETERGSGGFGSTGV